MATKLDEFKQEKKQIEFELNGKNYIAKTNALALLDVMSVMQEKGLKESDQIPALFKAVFGPEVTDELFENLNMAGIAKVTETIVAGLGLKQEGK